MPMRSLRPKYSLGTSGRPGCGDGTPRQRRRESEAAMAGSGRTRVWQGRAGHMAMNGSSDRAAIADSQAPSSRGLVLGMLCFVYVLNFLDRQLVSILAKPIQDSLTISDGELGRLTGFYFAFFYCFIAIPVGWLSSDGRRLGKKG